jgi:tRNA threonylcarbamoyladenosine modification (KEOPS) complex Cgi121 subunit
VAGLEHLTTAAKLTAISFKAGRNLARSPATELLLYASASRQIKEAIEKLGVSPLSRSWVLIAISDSKESLQKASELFLSYGAIDDSAIEIAPAKRARLMELYEISPNELSLSEAIHGEGDSALKALVLERVALSELYR